MSSITYTDITIPDPIRGTNTLSVITDSIFSEQVFGISNNFLPNDILNSYINHNFGVNTSINVEFNSNKVIVNNTLTKINKSVETISSVLAGTSNINYQTYFDTLILEQAPYGISEIINNNNVRVIVSRPSSYITVYGTGTDFTLNIQKTFYCSTKVGETSYSFTVPVPVDRIDTYGFTVGKSAAAYQLDTNSNSYNNIDLNYPDTYCATYVSATDLNEFLPPYITSYNYNIANKGVLLNYTLNKAPAKVFIRVLDYYSLNLIKALEYTTNITNNTIHLPLPIGKYVVRIDTLQG
jgi:hypothetical protein